MHFHNKRLLILVQITTDQALAKSHNKLFRLTSIQRDGDDSYCGSLEVKVGNAWESLGETGNIAVRGKNIVIKSKIINADLSDEVDVFSGTGVMTYEGKSITSQMYAE